MYDSNMPIWLPDPKFRFYKKEQGCLGILLGCLGWSWNAKSSCSQSLKVTGTPLSTQVTLCQHPLTSEWTKMRGNMGIMGTFHHAQFLTMSSYDQYFLGTQKVNYQLSNALSTMFLRRLDIFLHFETYVFQNPQKASSTDFHIYQLGFLPHIESQFQYL